MECFIVMLNYELAMNGLPV